MPEARGFGGRRIALAELVNEPWLLPPPGRALGPIYVEAFRASGLDYPRAAVFAAHPEVRLNLLATGSFLTIVPASALRLSTKRPGIKVLPVDFLETHSLTWLSHRSQLENVNVFNIQLAPVQ